MSPAVIQFSCSHCQSVLTVPAHLAGVAGPCPKCGQHIVSPKAAPELQTFAPPPVAPVPAAPASVEPPAQPHPQPQWAPAPELHCEPGGWGQPPTSQSAPPAPPPMAPPQVQQRPLTQPLGGGGSPWPAMKPPAAPPMDGGWGQPSTPPPAPQQGGWGQPSVPLAPPEIRAPALPMGQEAPPSMMGGMAPPAPQQHPMLQQRPATLPLTGGMPTLLGRTGASISQGPAAAPPKAPTNPVAEALMNLTQHAPAAHAAAQVGVTSPLSRPMTIGGSRLSLLARQLTGGAEGGDLPEAAEVPADELPGAAQNQIAARPNTARNKASADAIIRQKMRRGLHVSTGETQSGRFMKLVAALLLLAAGAGIAVYFMRDSLGIKLGNMVEAAKPVEPEVHDEVQKQPIPGVDPAPKLTVVKAPEPAPAVTPPAPVPAPTPKPAPPAPKPEETIEPVIAKADVKPVPEGMGIIKRPPPPRAVPVTEEPEEPQDKAVPRAQPVEEMPAPPPTPANEPKAETESNSAPQPVIKKSVRDEKMEDKTLVEVGRTKDDLKVLPGTVRSSLADSVERPIVKNVPPKCQVALDGLKAFLKATTWKERLPYMQLASQMQSKAEIYYSGNPDGPVEVDEIHYLRHDESPEVGKGMHVVFVLFSRAWEYGIPVMVEQTADGARVDWLTFVEFKDDLLHKFLTSYIDGPVRFHVGIRRTHYFEDNVPSLEEKDAFEVTTPMENVHGFVFVPKGTPLQRSLASTISWDKEMSWVIVELQWRRQGSSRWIEMTAMPQLNWYSADASDVPESVSAPSSGLAKPQQ